MPPTSVWTATWKVYGMPGTRPGTGSPAAMKSAAASVSTETAAAGASASASKWKSVEFHVAR